MSPFISNYWKDGITGMEATLLAGGDGGRGGGGRGWQVGPKGPAHGALLIQ